MNLNFSMECTKVFAEIQQSIKGETSFMLNLEDNRGLVGIILNGNKFNENFVYKKLNILKKKLKIQEYNHLMVGDKIILVQFEVE
ncbi:MAG: hypothetical protein RSA05_07650 [Cetobacterium sp.]